MTIESHLASLERKHIALEQELNKALTSPSTADQEIADLKRRKLKLKDEMERIRATTKH